MGVGDRVAFNISWLKNTGQSHSDVSHFRGEITEIEDMGQAKLATVSWEHGDIQKVLLNNLAIVGLKHKIF